MNEMRKPLLKISDKKIRKRKQRNRCQNAAYKQKTNSEKWKFGSNKKLGLQ